MSDVIIEYTDADGVAVVTLSRATTGNSLNPVVASEIADAITLVAASARCVILRSVGRVFCAGADLAFLDTLIGKTKEEVASSIYANFQRMIRSIVDCPVPVIASLQGGAAGAGCDLALACDFIVASESGWLEESWINIGATSALAGAFHLIQSAGPQRTLDLLLSGRRLMANEALSLGVVIEVAAPEDLDNATRKRAVAIASRDPEAVRAMKRLVRSAQHEGFEKAMENGLDLQGTLLSRPEFAVEIATLRSRLNAKTNA
ncbi:MAG TPA: enoyl-CoA hydratase/isomerase family protein [Acidimicrobiales bacterium]